LGWQDFECIFGLITPATPTLIGYVSASRANA
jgi:hypothetical protein